MQFADDYRHHPRAWRYQFKPSKYDPDLKSYDGIAQTPAWNVINSPLFGQLPDSPENKFTISNSTSGTFKMPGNRDYRQGLLINMYPGFQPAGLWIYAQITDSSYNEIDDETTVTFQAYDSQGSGTYSSWVVESQIRASLNFVQNQFPSAKESKDRDFVSTAQFFWPTDGVSENKVTSDTPELKAGYSESTYKGTCIVYEDEYEYNRPYVGITIMSTRAMEETTVTSTITYGPNPDDPPVIETNTVVAPLPSISHSYVISDTDFDPESENYVMGGQIGNGGPSPSHCINKTEVLGTYVGSSYEYNYEPYVPVPGRPPQYRLIKAVNKTSTFTDEGVGSMDPGTFFPVPG